MNKQEIGSRIKSLRKSKGMTQQDIANILHLDKKIISRWENGLSCPYCTDIGILAEIFGTTCDFLILGKE